MDRSALLWWHLNVLTKDRYDAVIQVFGSLEEAARQVNEEFLRGLGCKEETARAALIRLEEFDPDAAEAQLQRSGVSVLLLSDDMYPRGLRDIPDPPVFLSYRGDLSVLSQPCVAVVGTRQMSAYGRRVTEDFSSAFAQAGMVTVSGLAQGIDGIVAGETLKRGGRTVAVLGHGLGTIYPREHAELADAIVEGGGLLLSEYPLWARPDRHNFPARNRIVAALSMGTVVTEAPEGSGALITADLAFGYHKQVFSVPGQVYDPNYAGSNALIARSTARLVSAPEDVLRELGIVAPRARSDVPAYEPADASEAAVLLVLTTLPQPVNELVECTGLPPAAVGAALTMLELAGAARNVGAGAWVRA